MRAFGQPGTWPNMPTARAFSISCRWKASLSPAVTRRKGWLSIDAWINQTASLEKTDVSEDDPERPKVVRSLALTSESLGLTATLDLAEISGQSAVPVEYRKGRPKHISMGPSADVAVIWSKFHFNMWTRGPLIESKWVCKLFCSRMPGTRFLKRSFIMPVKASSQHSRR